MALNIETQTVRTFRTTVQVSDLPEDASETTIERAAIEQILPELLEAGFTNDCNVTFGNVFVRRGEVFEVQVSGREIVEHRKEQ